MYQIQSVRHSSLAMAKPKFMNNKRPHSSHRIYVSTSAKIFTSNDVTITTYRANVKRPFVLRRRRKRVKIKP